MFRLLMHVYAYDNIVYKSVFENQERPGLAADFWFDLALTALNVGKLACNFK